MTFGGNLCPLQWCCISETICDLANDLIQCERWDHRKLSSPNQHLIKPAIYLDAAIPFKPAKELAVNLPMNNKGSMDVYINDMLPICHDIGDNAEQCAAAVLLALHIMGLPVHPNEPIP